jgi:hypothetical protein
MARVYGIKKRMEQNNLDERAVNEIIGDGDLVNIIIRMEKLLDPEITYQILDSCACRISLKDINDIKGVKAETLEDKIK